MVYFEKFGHGGDLLTARNPELTDQDFRIAIRTEEENQSLIQALIDQPPLLGIRLAALFMRPHGKQ